jgi:hypothetical protein
MKRLFNTRFELVGATLAVAALMSGCAVYGPPPAYAQAHPPARSIRVCLRLSARGFGRIAGAINAHGVCVLFRIPCSGPSRNAIRNPVLRRVENRLLPRFTGRPQCALVRHHFPLQLHPRMFQDAKPYWLPMSRRSGDPAGIAQVALDLKQGCASPQSLPPATRLRPVESAHQMHDRLFGMRFE